MKLSIWQQFSANNSSSFSLIGHFRSIEEAIIAYEEIVPLLMALGEWYSRPENDHLRRRMWEPSPFLGEPLTPIEEEYSERFGIEWDDPIDWIQSPDDVGKAVSRLGTVVFLRSPSTTFQRGHLVTEMMKKLGAEIYDRDLEATVSAIAPFMSSPHETMLLHDRETKTHIVVQSGAQMTFPISGLYNLLALIRDLEARGFTNIDYEFKREDAP